MAEEVIRQVNRNFRNAYVLKAGFRFSALREYCQNIIYVTDGFIIDLNQLQEQLDEVFSEFDPDQDCLVPVGTAIVNILAGIMLAKQFPTSVISVGIYNREESPRKPEDYVFYDVPINLLFTPLSRKEEQYDLDPNPQSM